MTVKRSWYVCDVQYYTVRDVRDVPKSKVLDVPIRILDVRCCGMTCLDGM